MPPYMVVLTSSPVAVVFADANKSLRINLGLLLLATILAASIAKAFGRFLFAQQIKTLREGEERFRMLASESPISIMDFDAMGNVTFVSNWHLKTFSKNRLGSDFFLGRKVWELPSIVSSGLSERCQKNSRRGSSVLERCLRTGKQYRRREVSEFQRSAVLARRQYHRRSAYSRGYHRSQERRKGASDKRSSTARSRQSFTVPLHVRAVIFRLCSCESHPAYGK
jgi:hypothetical protein